MGETAILILTISVFGALCLALFAVRIYTSRNSTLGIITRASSVAALCSTGTYLVLLICLRYFPNLFAIRSGQFNGHVKFALPFTALTAVILSISFLITLAAFVLLFTWRTHPRPDFLANLSTPLPRIGDFLANLSTPVLWIGVAAVSGGATFIALQSTLLTAVHTASARWPKASGEAPGLVLPSDKVQQISDYAAENGTENIPAVTAIAESTSNLSVYNAIMSPVTPDTTNILIDKAPTNIDFYVGEAVANNVIPQTGQQVSPRIRSLLEPEVLTVTLSCSFCDGSEMQQKDITLEPGNVPRSSHATFTITPIAALTAEGVSNLVFQITGKAGILYDSVVVPVGVRSGAQPTRAAAASPALSALGNISQPPGMRPIDLTIVCKTDGLNIKLLLRPDNQDLAALFKSREKLKPGEEWREFDTGLTWPTLSARLLNDYLLLSGIVNQDPDLQKAVTGGDPPLIIPQITRLKPAEGQQLVERLARAGQFLYEGLFNNDADLKDLIADLEKFKKQDGTPLLIRIVTRSISLPWQFLHPLGPTDAESFWGFRYELVIDPVPNRNGYYPGQLHYKNGPLIFGKYHSIPGDGNQLVDNTGQAEFTFLSTILGLKGVLPAVDSKQSFIDSLAQKRQSVQLLVVFTHARSDVVPTQGPGGNTAAPPIGGPAIEFRAREIVNIGSLEDLHNSVAYPDTFNFQEQPLVILNGCGTGSMGYLAPSDRNFPTKFLSFGARGVIATEAPVWTLFADDFATALFQGMKKTSGPVSLVLMNARKDFLHSYNNPLGLLYSYYGGVDSSLVVQ
jgi:hypothetical protein